MEDKKKNEVINAKELEQVAGGLTPFKGRFQDEQGNWVEESDGIKVAHILDIRRKFDNDDL